MKNEKFVANAPKELVEQTNARIDEIIAQENVIKITSNTNGSINISVSYDKTFDNVYISNISANNLYCIQNNTMIPINNNQEVYALTSYSESSANFSENACRFSIPKTFIYQDGSLIPKKSSPAGIQLYSQKFTGSGWGYRRFAYFRYNTGRC